MGFGCFDLPAIDNCCVNTDPSNVLEREIVRVREGGSAAEDVWAEDQQTGPGPWEAQLPVLRLLYAGGTLPREHRSVKYRDRYIYLDVK